MNDKKLPLVAEILLKLFLPEIDYDYLLGDYTYLYNEKKETNGLLFAKLWIVVHTLRTIPSYIYQSLSMGAMMLKNYFLIAIRSISRNRIYSLINIGGFAVGLAAVIFIGLFINYELSYDKVHSNYDNIFRVTSNLPASSGISLSAPVSTGRTRDDLIEKIPEITKATRIETKTNYAISHEDKKFIEKKGLYVDQDFVEIFTTPVIDGELKNALSNVNTMVVTKNMAIKYFGRTDVAGETLIVEEKPFKITAVVENSFSNSHIKFDFLLSIISNFEGNKNALSKRGISYYTYFLVDSKNPENVFPKVKEVAQEGISKLMGKKSLKMNVSSDVQAFADVHLHSNMQFELEANGDINDVLLFALLGAVILIIAMINFVNIVTAKSQLRVTEIGIRKTLGAFRLNLINQFLGESIILTLIALIAALGLVSLLITPFADLMRIPLSISAVFNPSVFIKIVLFTVFVGVLAGLYPALFLSKLEPSRAIKSKRSLSNSKSFLRKFLVISQFSISITLIASIFVFQDQISYLKKAELGFDKEQVVVFQNLTPGIKSKADLICSELSRLEEVENAAQSGHLIGDQVNKNPVRIIADGEEKKGTVNQIEVSYNYLETIGVKLKEGRNFSKEIITDLRESVIVNEAFIKHFNLANPISKSVKLQGRNRKIVGVVKNFHFASLKHKIEPIIINVANWSNFLSVKLNSNDVKSTLNSVISTLNQFDPDYKVDYNFMNESFNAMYKNEERANTLFILSALLAIIISIVGLFALAAFTTERRTKEIGIRKVMGASIKEINRLLLKDFIYLIIIANIIALPIAYFSLEGWLLNFEYRIDLSIWPFIFAALISFIVSIASVVSQIYKAALANPVKSLKTE